MIPSPKDNKELKQIVETATRMLEEHVQVGAMSVNAMHKKLLASLIHRAYMLGVLDEIRARQAGRQESKV